jgi:periplasmic protein TonB
METNKILSADVLDILFEGRNKEYGAYMLRKGYNGRLGRALLVMAGVVVLLFCFGFVSRRGPHRQVLVIDDTIILVGPVEPVVPPPPPPPPKPVVQVATKIFVTPRIVPNDQADAPPPAVDDLENVKIGTVNTPGAADVSEVAPPAPVGQGSNVVEAPKKEGDDRFIPIEKEAEYPGGVLAWVRYLEKNLRLPETALSEVGKTRVEVRFIVDKDGNVSDVEAISGPEQNGMREEAVRVIKKSGKWVPALQNGRYVRTVKVQPVIFEIESN